MNYGIHGRKDLHDQFPGVAGIYLQDKNDPCLG